MPYADKEKQNAWHREFRKNNLEHCKAKERAQHLKHKEYRNAKNLEWRKANKEKIKAQVQIFNHGYYISKKYGITKSEYVQMLHEQKVYVKFV